MFIALGLTFLGMAVGYLLRRSPWPGRLTRGITPVIMLLLLGGAALTLTLAGLAGSLACTLLVSRVFRRGSGAPSGQGRSKKDAHEDR